jgi:hypothetical protein
LRDRVTIASMRAHRSTRDTGSGGDSGGGSPGARTRTQALAVQRKVAPPRPIAATTPPSTAEPHDDPFALHLDPVQRRGGDERAGVHEAAARGIAGAGERLPHHDAIARAFGPDHDVSGIVAHTDGAARAAAADMGALGFATGNHVAFAGPPDLHTAAHEAAHVFQQRAGVQLDGGLGEVDDVYERQADEIAERVVAGESAADLLPGSGAAPTAPVTAEGDGRDADAQEAQDQDPSAVEHSEDTSAIDKPLVAGRPPGAVQQKAKGRRRPAKAAPRKLPIDEAVKRYAPLVFLHKDERHGPTDAGQYIASSELVWSHDQGRGDHVVAERGEIDQTKLGDGGYSHSTNGWVGGHHDDHHASNDDVRPADGTGPSGNEGFFLEPGDGVKQGADPNTNAPVYHDAKDGHYITYWFFFGYNAGLNGHQGDWERIIVKLDRRNRPTMVRYHQHDSHQDLPWSKVPKQGNHPLVFTAKGSHASYSKPGRHHYFTDVAGRGKQWKTWNNLRTLRNQAWYGYGGAWGEVGVSKHTTGPSGPSSHKPSAPEDW